MGNKVILLDIDGVLVTNPSWKRPDLMKDGFPEFNARAAANLSHLLSVTAAHIILTTSHRHSYSLTQWTELLKARGIITNNISTVDGFISGASRRRVDEILEWLAIHGETIQYVIIDDDTSLDGLPAEYKTRWVKTLPLIGLDESATNKALQILGIV